MLSVPKIYSVGATLIPHHVSEQYRQEHLASLTFVPSLGVIESLSLTFLHDFALMLKRNLKE